jgi:uncharacterized protein YpmS
MESNRSNLKHLMNILLAHAIIVFVLFALLFIKVQSLTWKVMEMQEVISTQVETTENQIGINENVIKMLNILFNESRRSRP